MTAWKKALLYGFLLWLIPFVAAVLISPVRNSNRPLFESIMPVVATACAMLFAIGYQRTARGARIADWYKLGFVWLAISLLFDWPMFAAGPMKMTLAGYMSDIGLTYLLYPAVTMGCGHLLRPPAATVSEAKAAPAGSDSTV